MAWEGINNRQFPRVSYKCFIHVSKDGRDEVLETCAVNIGLGGIAVVLDSDLGLFENVFLEIFLGEDSAPIHCEGKIVWVVKKYSKGGEGAITYDTGVEFENISSEGKERISVLVGEILRANT
ncbi:MAG: PilZ domain-containing protein [Candidatus Omnitrophica bacterium]|nr:PilZ domain-containing protein [Candidatus Omnitrophota bacterium]